MTAREARIVEAFAAALYGTAYPGLSWENTSDLAREFSIRDAQAIWDAVKADYQLAHDVSHEALAAGIAIKHPELETS